MTRLSSEDIFGPTAGASESEPEAARKRRREASLGYLAFMDALRRTCETRILGDPTAKTIRWRDGKLLTMPSDPAGSVVEIEIDCWLSPAAAVCRPRFTTLSATSIRSAIDTTPHSPLLLAPWCIAASFVRPWAVVMPAGSAPDSERAARKRAAAEVKTIPSLRGTWMKEVGETWSEDEGSVWLVCSVEDSGRRKEVVWPADRCLLDLARRHAPSPTRSIDLLKRLQADDPGTFDSIETLVAEVSDYVATQTKPRESGKREARSDPSTSAVGTPVFGAGDAKSDTLGVTPSSFDARPSPASFDASASVDTPAAAATADTASDRGPHERSNSFWGEDFGIVDPSPRPDAGGAWNRSTFDDAADRPEDFDMDSFDVDVEFSFFDNPSADDISLGTVHPPAATKPTANGISPPVTGVSPQFANGGPGSGFTASPSSLNTALFETPGSFSSQTPGRPGYTPDTGAVPTPSSAVAGQNTPPDTVVPADAAAVIHRSPTIPSVAFGSLTLAPASPRLSRMQPIGFEEVSFRPIYACPDSHYSSLGKYSVPERKGSTDASPDNGELRPFVPAKRSFYSQLADPRAHVLQRSDPSKRARPNARLPQHPDWQADDPSDYSDAASDQSDSNIMLTDDEDYESDGDADYAYAGVAAHSTLQTVLNSLTRRLSTLAIVTPKAGPSAAPSPIFSSIGDDAGSSSPAAVIVPPSVAARLRDAELSVPIGALPRWSKIGLEPSMGKKDVHVSMVICYAPDTVSALATAAETWLGELAGAYQVRNFADYKDVQPDIFPCSRAASVPPRSAPCASAPLSKACATLPFRRVGMPSLWSETPPFRSLTRPTRPPFSASTKPRCCNSVPDQCPPTLRVSTTRSRIRSPLSILRSLLSRRRTRHRPRGRSIGSRSSSKTTSAPSRNSFCSGPPHRSTSSNDIGSITSPTAFAMAD